MRRVLAVVLGLLLAFPALAQTRTGPLVIQNALGEIAANGTQATARANLGLPLGTSGATVPLLSGANTWSGSQTLGGAGTGLAVINDATVGGNLTVTGTITGAGGSFLPLSGGTLSGALSGTSGAFATLSSASDATIGGALGLTGAATLAGGLSQSTTITLAGNTTNNAASSGILATQIFNGTNSVALGAQLNSLTINDHLNWTGSTNGVTGFGILHNYGPSNVGGRDAFLAILNQTAATTDLADNYYLAAAFQGIANFNNGGTGGTAKGRMFGANSVVHLKPGATNYYQATGMEIDAVIDTGASALIKTGLSIASLGPLNTVQGSLVDAGIWFYASNGAPLKTAILIGGGAGLNNYPIDPAGSYISDDTSGIITASTAYGLHFVGAFTTASISVPGFSVDGTGIVTGASYKAGATAGVTCATGAPTASFSASGGIVTHC